MTGDSGISGDEAGSGIEPPVEPRSVTAWIRSRRACRSAQPGVGFVLTRESTGSGLVAVHTTRQPATSYHRDERG